MKKKVLSILLVGILVVGLTGCGSNANTNTSNKTSKDDNKVEENSNKQDKDNQEETQKEEKASNGKYAYMATDKSMIVNSAPTEFGGIAYQTPEEAMSNFGANVFVRHTLDDGLIKEVHIGFKYDEEIYYLKALDSSEYLKNKKILEDVFGKDKCVTLDNDTTFTCSDSTQKILVTMYNNGYVMVQDTTNSKSAYCYAKIDKAICSKK